MLRGYSKRNRKARRTTRRTKRGFGDTKTGHRARAARYAPGLRMEVAVIRKHLAEGQCRAAIRGLSQAGYMAGKYASERMNARPKGKVRVPNSARVIFALADRIARQCVVSR